MTVYTSSTLRRPVGAHRVPTRWDRIRGFFRALFDVEPTR